MILTFLIEFSLCYCSSSSLKLKSTAQHLFLLVSGSQMCLEAVKTNTVIIFDVIGNATASVCINDGSDCIHAGDLGLFSNNTNITGFWFGNHTGAIELSTEHLVTVKFTYAILPSTCTTTLITNTRNYTMRVRKEELNYTNNFCFFAGTYGTYTYKASYDLSDDDLLHIVRNDNIPRDYYGNNRFHGVSSKDDPAIFTINSNISRINSEVNISVYSQDIIPDTNITLLLNSSNYSFLYGQYLDDFPPDEIDDKYSDIVSICLVVIFLLTAIGCLIYRIVSYLRKKKLKEQKAIEMMNAPKKRYKKIYRSNHQKKKVLEDLDYVLSHEEDEASKDCVLAEA